MKRNTLYALNKLNTDAIIYTDSYGNNIRLTVDDFASEEEFLHWKKWSDENYHATEKNDHIEANNTLLLDSKLEHMTSVTDNLTPDYDERELLGQLLRKLTQTVLTPTQNRRLWMYAVDGLNEFQIAERECVSQQAISKSIADAKAKIVKFL